MIILYSRILMQHACVLSQEDEVISEIIRQYDALHNSESDGCKYGTAGTNWNLIYAPWWQSWRAYISENNTRKMDSEPSRPGVIDNWPLMGVPGTERVHLKRTLRIHKDFIVIPPRAWAMLQVIFLLLIYIYTYIYTVC